MSRGSGFRMSAAAESSSATRGYAAASHVEQSTVSVLIRLFRTATVIGLDRPKHAVAQALVQPNRQVIRHAREQVHTESSTKNRATSAFRAQGHEAWANRHPGPGARRSAQAGGGCGRNGRLEGGRGDAQVGVLALADGLEEGHHHGREAEAAMAWGDGDGRDVAAARWEGAAGGRRSAVSGWEGWPGQAVETRRGCLLPQLADSFRLAHHCDREDWSSASAWFSLPQERVRLTITHQPPSLPSPQRPPLPTRALHHPAPPSPTQPRSASRTQTSPHPTHPRLLAPRQTDEKRSPQVAR